MFDPQAMNRFVRMLPTPSDHHRHKHRPRDGGACGSCPSCGEFVLIEHLDKFAGTACPSCGLVVNGLLPLGDGS